MEIPHQLYLNGQWRDSSDGATVEVIDPASEETIDSVPVATAADVDLALDSSARAFDSFREVEAWSRAQYLRAIADFLREHLDPIALTLTEEQGKPLAEAKGEILASADQFDWYAGEAQRIYGRLVEGHHRGHRLLVMRQPIGPVAAFVPYNFPALLAARKMAPAIAAGCTVIVKPPIEAPRTTYWLAEACHQVGLPPGVVNMITGRSSQISQQLIASEVVRKVSLTGSVRVGQQLMALCARHVKPISLELGGHSPVLVFEDAELDRAAEICARGKFRNAGQVCISASRFYVQESVAQRFIERFVQVARSLRVGDGRVEGVDVGPLTNRTRLAATEQLVEDAVAQGATAACGGRRPREHARGFFYEPTVLTGVEPSMRIMREEPFCPVAPIATFRSLEDGIEKANATEYGLAGYLFTQSTRTAFLAAERLDVGMVGVNNLVIATAECPFGGIKQSGFGREGGQEWIESYTVSKYVNLLL
ncbi:MAG: NAD-dependent succinate-semialdehyde dehydrogenase [Bradymonadales bacterium]|nr:NAD-dependent succinate-semialdehyde dehydrogenase [Bradymonadales bacterium]